MNMSEKIISKIKKFRGKNIKIKISFTNNRHFTYIKKVLNAINLVSHYFYTILKYTFTKFNNNIISKT